jgi:hypothetical protein
MDMFSTDIILHLRKAVLLMLVYHHAYKNDHSGSELQYLLVFKK